MRSSVNEPDANEGTFISSDDLNHVGRHTDDRLRYVRIGWREPHASIAKPVRSRYVSEWSVHSLPLKVWLVAGLGITTFLFKVSRRGQRMRSVMRHDTYNLEVYHPAATSGLCNGA